MRREVPDENLCSNRSERAELEVTGRYICGDSNKSHRSGDHAKHDA